MIDIGLEVARAVVAAGLFGYLVYAGLKYRLMGQRGWETIEWGFGLILFGSVIDITDNFDSLNVYVFVGDTDVQAFLEKFVGYLSGSILVLVGFWYWLPVATGIEAGHVALKPDKNIAIPIALAAGVAVSAGAFAFASQSHQRHLTEEFEEQSANYTMMVGRSIDRYLEVVRSISSLHTVSGVVERKKFGEFARRSLMTNPGIQALEWIPRVPAAQRAAYEEEARRDGLADFQFRELGSAGELRPATARDEYFPVYFVEPLEGNEAALGFDLASNPARREALERARDTGTIVASRSITLAQETGNQKRLLTFAPVYGGAGVPQTIEERRERLTGFALGVFRIGDIIERAFENVVTPTDFDLYLLDDSAPVGERLLHVRFAPGRSGPAAPVTEETIPSDLIYATSYDVAGRRWSLRFRPLQSAAPGSLSQMVPWAVASLGLLLTLLLVQHLISSRHRTMRVEQLVADRSKELMETNRALEEEIVERERMEKHLSQVQKMEAIGQLTGGIAHDFNNLLMVVDGYARRALRTLGDEQSTEKSLVEVLRATERAAKLTKQLLAFSRRQVMEKRVFRVDGVLLEIRELLHQSVGELLDLKYALQDGSACVETDPSEFSQAIVNLAVNARDAMPMGGSITIATRVIESPSADAEPGATSVRFVEVAVKDDGEGIDESVAPHIFEPFFTTKEQGKGTGLGLAMVYGFARQSGGTVGVESRPGEGTTIRIFLPVVDRKPQAEQPPLEDVPRGNGETILVLEDDDALLALTHNSLEDLGYRVLAAASGLEALEVEEGHKGAIDLLLSDVVMPGMGGFEVAEMIRENRPDMRIVFMSGYPNRGRANSANLLPDTQFLQKPVPPDRLAEIIRSELDNADARFSG